MNRKIKCDQCEKLRMIFVKEICLSCHEKSLARVNLDAVEASFRAKLNYNEYIFDLFLRYIRRCQLRSGYVNQAKRLKNFLGVVELPVILSWRQIHELSAKHENYDNHYQNKGCAFRKIGRMLQELGVIGASSEEGRDIKRFDRLQEQLNKDSKIILLNFLNVLKSQKRSLRTRILYLEHIIRLQKWFVLQGFNDNILLLTVDHLKSYIIHLRSEKYSDKRMILMIKY